MVSGQQKAVGGNYGRADEGEGGKTREGRREGESGWSGESGQASWRERAGSGRGREGESGRGRWAGGREVIKSERTSGRACGGRGRKVGAIELTEESDRKRECDR